MNDQYIAEGGERVLIMGRVTDDAANVRLAPGVELPIRSVDIATDIPRGGPEHGNFPKFLLLVFATEEDRQDFADTFAGWPNVETRDLNRAGG